MLKASVQTFLVLRAAEAAGGFLELVTINFDHPKWPEHLSQVGRFITAGRIGLNKSVPTEILKNRIKCSLRKSIVRFHQLNGTFTCIACIL